MLCEGTVTSESDGWQLQLMDLRDGPNMHRQGNLVLFPENGAKFLWAHVILKNTAPMRRSFDFKTCVLDFGQYGIPASMIAWSLHMTNYGMATRNDYDSGEDRERYLGFAYPVEYLPRVLACGPNVIKLQYTNPPPTARRE